MTETQSIFPTRADYTPPPPADEFRLEPSRVSVRAVTAEGTAVEQAHAAITHAADTFRRHITATEPNRHLYTEEGYRQQVAAFADTDAFKAADRAEAQLLAARDRAQTNADSIFQKLSPDGDAAAESRATRYWHRTERLLDNTDRKLLAARELVHNATPTELGTLLQELGPYLQANNVSTGWLDVEIARKVPEYAAAKESVNTLDAAWQITRHNLQRLRTGITSARALTRPPLDPTKNYNA